MPNSLGIYAVGFAVAALATLMIHTGHGPHALDYLPFLIIPACPLMHLFMHGRHHHAGGDHSHVSKE